MNYFNHKSDFDLVLLVADANDKTVNMNNYDWTARFSTTRGSRSFIAEHRGKATNNAFIEYGAPHIIFNDHCLGVGQLMLELTVLVKDENFPDGSRRVVTPIHLPVELVSNQGNTGTSAQVNISLPFTQVFTAEDKTDDPVHSPDEPMDKPSEKEETPGEKDPVINWEEVK